MKKTLRTVVLIGLTLAASASVCFSEDRAQGSTPAGSGSPDFTAPTFTYEVQEPSVLLKFTDNSNEDDYYRIYRVDENGATTLIDNIPGNQPGVEQLFDDSGAQGGTYYTYYADAVLQNGNTLSRVAEVYFLQPLEAPIIHMGYPNLETCGSEVLLEYEHIYDSPHIYTEIFRSSSPTSGFVKVATTTSTLYLDDVAPRKTYYYKVRDGRDGHVSGFSEVKTVTVESDYYDPELSVRIVDSGIEITLRDRSYVDEHYSLYQESTDGIIVLKEIVLADSGSTYTMVDTTVQPNTDYTYVINAKVKTYCGKYSWPWYEDVASATINAGPGRSCAGAGSITRDLWTNVPGLNLTDIPSGPPTSTAEITTFETPNYAGNNYAARIYGYVCVPQTGYYTFWIASDDQSALYLSTDEQPENKYKIAYVNKAVKFREYTKYAYQQSAPTHLIQGRKYYIEALHKEGNGADHISVGWQMPDGTLQRPIQGQHLIPYEYEPNIPPTVTIIDPPDNFEENFANGVYIHATASDADGTIAKVEFIINGAKMAEDMSAPYEYHWTYFPEGTHEIIVKAYDNGNAVASDTVTYIVNYPDCPNAGLVNWEIWDNIGGTDISSIPVNTEPSLVNTQLDFETDQYQGNNYGSRIRAYLCVPSTGYYTFWVAADDKAQLWLSTDDDPANKRLIASVNSATRYRQYDRYASQKSSSIYLEKGINYYIEALHKEANGNDHLSVGWQLPDGTLERPIRGIRMIEFAPQYTFAAASTPAERVQIDDAEVERISVYPNPAPGRRVSLTGLGADEGPVRIQVISAAGAVIVDQIFTCSGDCAQIDLDLGKSPSGLYAVQIMRGRKRNVLKLVLE
ncbi:hypothetical protein KK083_00415 [Fulvivirgaceae bacterium PWU4]|uniref:PA14 domain-containing protein n=1 Tax=Chryseosolibacter histidini TaxID=2782349 RepID=A0AAP2DFD0_9BACT|nr:PA14 domain-containing protein [Chryseosolibacter histidini]MBT1695315.1 hypothetical protein [Chryseosolibacter histidini]